MISALLHIATVLVFPPLMLGVIGKTKAAFAGRVGPPLLQPYYDLWKLMRKDSVFSRTTTWLFKAGPVVGVVTTLFAAAIVPMGQAGALFCFSGDVLLFAYLLGLGRFFTVAAALDTGSAFEGMGGAREVTFSCLAEPALFFAFLVLARLSGATSMERMLSISAAWEVGAPSLVLVLCTLFIVLLAENCRIPFDDPNTHLELTMIHEVMVLDHSGPAFGLITYGAALKLFVLGSLLVGMVLPAELASSGGAWLLFVALELLLAILVGVVESVMARLRLVHVPSLLIAACLLGGFAIVLAARAA